ncbi:MAG: DNA cytosine methyltransferase, partial [Chloroflexota bacterium]
SDIARWEIIEGDVRGVDFASFGALDLIAGGPPCQPFSIGGKHRGTEDSRNMIPEFIRAVREVMPRAFIMENVRGLLRPAFGDYFSYALLELTYPSIERRLHEEWPDHYRRLLAAREGGAPAEYLLDHQVVNAADYGIPQFRARVFVVGFRADQAVAWRFPGPTHARDALLRDQWVTGAYWDKHGLERPPTPLGMSTCLDRLSRLELPFTSPWRTMRDAIADLPEPAHFDVPGILNHRYILGARSYPGHTGSVLDWPAKTLKAGGHGVPGGENMIALPDGSVRYFTVRESARLQTFPDTWRFEGAWGEIMRQLGNAVPMELARVMASAVMDRLVGVDGG